MIENSQVLEYIGETKTENRLNDISKEYFEIQQKEFPNFQISKSLSIVSITKPKESEILGIGISCINDLLNDNWGEFLRVLFSSYANATFTDDAGASDSYQFSNGISGNASPYNVNNNPAGQVGSVIQVGKGLATKTRSMFDTQIPFTNGGVEDNKRNTGNGGFNVGLSQVDIPCQISPTASSGAISEANLFSRWHSLATGNNYILLSADNISPVVNFISGETINIDYKILLS